MSSVIRCLTAGGCGASSSDRAVWPIPSSSLQRGDQVAEETQRPLSSSSSDSQAKRGAFRQPLGQTVQPRRDERRLAETGGGADEGELAPEPLVEPFDQPRARHPVRARAAARSASW